MEVADRRRTSTSADVWWARPHDLAPNEIDDVLDDADRRALFRLHDDERAASRRVARALVRLVAARLLHCDPREVTVERRCTRCGEEGHGRPYVADAPFELSTAVTASIAVVASGGAAIGVDVVNRSCADAAIEAAPVALTPDDVAALDGMAPARRGESALVALSQLEAYSKASGLALTTLAGKIPVSLDPQRPRLDVQDHSLVAIRVDPDDQHVVVLVVDPPPAAVCVRNAASLFRQPAVRNLA